MDESVQQRPAVVAEGGAPIGVGPEFVLAPGVLGGEAAHQSRGDRTWGPGPPQAQPSRPHGKAPGARLCTVGCGHTMGFERLPVPGWALEAHVPSPSGV